MSHTIRHICTAHGRRAGKSVVVALMTLACSMAAWAVEFGAVTVNSQQGQPLNADVVLLDLPVQSAADIAVTATNASEWPGLTAMARSKPDGVVYVHIETTKPVDRSELTLQFDIRYPTTPPTNGVALLATLQRSVALTIPAATLAVQAPQVQGPVSLDVVRGTTASEIVYERLTDARANGATMSQMLVALQNQNPDAFIESNVNLIKAGKSIQLPSTAAVLSVDAKLAAETVAAQNQAFKARKQRLAELAKQAKATQDPTKGSVQAAASESAATGDRLELAAAESANQQADTLAKEAAQAERASAEEAAAERVKALEALTAQANTPAVGAASGATATNDNASSSDTVVTAPALPPSAQAEAPEPEVANGLMDRVRAHPIWAHPQVQNSFFKPFLILLALILVWVFWPRRFAPATDPELDPNLYSPDVSQALSLARAEAATHEVSESADLPVGGDPLTRANALWSEGAYELAIHTINSGIAQRPDRSDYYMALLNFHLQQGASLAFEATARELQTVVDEDSAEWAQCCDWGQRLDPGNPLYGPVEQRDINEVTSLKASDLDL